METEYNDKMKKILNQKENILNHVLYEMEMYLYTMFAKSENQLIINLILVSHLIHLRNLLYFFSDDKGKKTDIIYSDVIAGINMAIGKETKKSAKDIINKSIAHLTEDGIEPKERFTIKTIKLINDMKIILPPKICIFIEALDKSIKEKYKHELDDPDIKNLLDIIKKLLNNDCKHFRLTIELK